MKKLIYLLILVIIVSGCAAKKPHLELIMNPKTAKDYCQRALYFQGKNELLQAIAEYRQAIALDQNYADAYFKRSVCYMGMGNYEDAASDLTQLIALQPKKPGYYRFRATCYTYLEDVGRAIADHDTTISLSPKNYWYHRYKADLLFQEARFREANSAYKEFLKKFSVRPTGKISSFEAYINPYAQFWVKKDPFSSGMSDEEDVRIKEEATAMVQLCEELIREENLYDTARAMSPGMSKQEVLKTVMATDKMMTGYSPRNSDNSLLVTVSRTGPIEDRNIRILVFDKDILAQEKRVPLSEVMGLPGISKYSDILRDSNLSRSDVLERIRKTDYILYEDERQIVSVTEWDTQKGKRVRFFTFDNNKLKFRIFGSRRLWEGKD